MRYQVPQYLEVEDRIFGPLTLKQFLFAAGGVGGAYALYALLPAPLGAIAGVIIAIAAATLGFGQMNGRPFLVMVESMVSYSLSKKLYLWRKVPRPVAAAGDDSEPVAPVIPRLSESKLKDLAWGLDIHEALAQNGAPLHHETVGEGGRIPTLPPGII